MVSTSNSKFRFLAVGKECGGFDPHAPHWEGLKPPPAGGYKRPWDGTPPLKLPYVRVDLGHPALSLLIRPSKDGCRAGQGPPPPQEGNPCARSQLRDNASWRIRKLNLELLNQKSDYYPWFFRRKRIDQDCQGSESWIEFLWGWLMFDHQKRSRYQPQPELALH